MIGQWRLRRCLRAVAVAAAVVCLPLAAPAADLPGVLAKLTQSQALMQAGRMDAALVANGEALALAEAGGERSLVLQMLLMRLVMQTALGQLPDGEATARRAQAWADAETHPAMPMATFIDISTSLLYTTWGRPAQAAPFARRALARVDAADPSGALRQASLAALAQVEAERGQYALAVQLTEQEIAMGVRALPPGPANQVDRQVDALMRLAVLRSKRGDGPGARDAWVQALPLQLKAAGPDSGAPAQLALARIHHGLGQDTEARAAWAQARAAALADGEAPAQGPSTPTDFMAHLQRAVARIAAWQGIGRLARDLGQPDAAEQAFRRAMALSERLEGPANMTLLATQLGACRT